MRHHYQSNLRALVPVEDLQELRTHLEPCGGKVWLSRTVWCERFNLFGVPAKRIDVLMDPLAASNPLLLVEVGTKAGRFDGALRERLTLRRIHAGMPPAPTASMLVKVDEEQMTITLRAPTGLVFWQRTEKTLRSELHPGQSLSRLVTWHWSRFYKHLSWEAVEAIAESFTIPEGTTVTAANRMASQRLYEVSRELGWSKLTLRERLKLGLGADASMWQRTEYLAGIRMGRLAATGCGDWTLEHAGRMGS